LRFRTTGDDPKVFLEIDLSGVTIPVVKTGGSINDDLFAEQVTLRFRAVRFRYIKINSDGSVDPAVELDYEVPDNGQSGDCDSE
jgi:type VI protein secretion system component Hcp